MSKSVKRIALVSAGALICAPLFAQSQLAAPTPGAAPAATKSLLQQDRDYYFNNVAPAVAQNESEDAQVGAKAKKAQAERPEAKRITGFPRLRSNWPSARRWLRPRTSARERAPRPPASQRSPTPSC